LNGTRNFHGVHAVFSFPIFPKFSFWKAIFILFLWTYSKARDFEKHNRKKIMKKNSNPVWIKWKLQTHLYLYNLSFICFSWPFFTLKKNHTPTEFLRVKLERKRNEQHFDIPQHDTSYYAVRSCKGAFYGQFFCCFFVSTFIQFFLFN
jgi:hypothetical protein